MFVRSHMQMPDTPLFITHVGVHICEQRDGGCSCSLKVEPHHFNTGGIVHGGVAYTLADTAMGVALISCLPEGERCVTIDVSISYFKPVLTGILECAATVVNRGSSIANVEASIYAAGVLVAKAAGNYAIVRSRSQNAT